MWLLILAVRHMDPTYLHQLWRSCTLLCAQTHTGTATTPRRAPQPPQRQQQRYLQSNALPHEARLLATKPSAQVGDFQRWWAVCGRWQLFETGSEMWLPYLRPFSPWETITEARAFDVSTAVKVKTGVEINRGSRRRGSSFFLLLGSAVSPFDGWASLKKEKYLEGGYKQSRNR